MIWHNCIPVSSRLTERPPIYLCACGKAIAFAVAGTQARHWWGQSLDLQGSLLLRCSHLSFMTHARHLQESWLHYQWCFKMCFRAYFSHLFNLHRQHPSLLTNESAMHSFPTKPTLRSPVLHVFGHESFKSSKVFQKSTNWGRWQPTVRPDTKLSSAKRGSKDFENEITTFGQTEVMQKAEGNEVRQKIHHFKGIWKVREAKKTGKRNFHIQYHQPQPLRKKLS